MEVSRYDPTNLKDTEIFKFKVYENFEIAHIEESKDHIRGYDAQGRLLFRAHKDSIMKIEGLDERSETKG